MVWDELQWWEKLTYLEGLRREFGGEEEAQSDTQEIALPVRSITGKADWG